jgi:hypothetical protein
MLTSELASLTTPEEQDIVLGIGSDLTRLRIGSEPAYRPDLPQHNLIHAFGEVAPEGIRLLEKSGESTPGTRRIMLGGLTLHDIFSTRLLDPDEGFATVEERAAALAEPILSKLLDRPEAAEAQRIIRSSYLGHEYTDLLELITRRADIVNVGSPTATPFLAVTVKIFHEKIMLWREATIDRHRDQPRTLWTPYLDVQYSVLRQLLERDLSVGDEKRLRYHDGRYLGVFNRNGERNASLLGAKHSVRNPISFNRRYGRFMRLLVPDYESVRPYILGTI